MSYYYESARDLGAAERPDTSSDEQLAWLAQQEEAERVRTDCRSPIPSPRTAANGEQHTPYRSHSPRAILNRLAGVTFMPHVLRVNHHRSPSEDAEHTSRARLEEKIAVYGLAEKQVAGDGNCQFRALSDQLFGTAENHQYVRKVTVCRLREAPDEYRPYVPGDWDEYLATMSQSGTWGDNITLQAFADAMGIRVNIISSYEESCVIEITPSTGVKERRPLWISFWAEVHYNSLYPEEEPADQYEEPGHRLRKFFLGHRLHMLCRGCPVVVS